MLFETKLELFETKLDVCQAVLDAGTEATRTANRRPRGHAPDIRRGRDEIYGLNAK